MGKIYDRQGVYYYDLRVKGRRIRKRLGKSKRLAELALKDLELKAERNQLGFLDRREVAIQDFFDQFRKYSETSHRPASQRRYQAVVANFLQFIQKHTACNKLSQITPETIEKYKIHRRTTPVARNGGELDRLKEKTKSTGAKGYTVNFEITALRTLFNLAVKWKQLESNPASQVSLLKTDDSKKRRFLSDIECQWLLQHTPKDFYPVIFAFLNTGMRRAELVNLQWSDLDFEAKVIKIQRKTFWLPKTGEREIPINDELARIFERLPKRSEFVFTDSKGRQLNPDSVRERLVEIAKKAGVADLTEVHALRHTFASRLIQKGVDLPTVQKLMGHSSIETTMIYTHQTTQHLHQAVAKLQSENALVLNEDA